MSTKIIALASGKGGVGKSMVASNLAVYLSKLNYSVIAIDLDLGCANLHSHLGNVPSGHKLCDYIRNKDTKLLDIATNTDFHNLKFISGANDDIEFARIKETKCEWIIHDIKNSGADYAILDLGAGNAEYTINFFNGADKKLLITTPEPTSIENIHRFAKVSFLNQFKKAKSDLKIKNILSEKFNNPGVRVETPAELLKEIQRNDPLLGQKVRAIINNSNLYECFQRKKSK